jgi:triphosphoribosyl-dephospho-CoA synthase
MAGITAPAATAWPELRAPAARTPRVREEAAERLARHAVEALIAEALLTPKPALVDQRGPGAHRDLDLARLIASARSLRAGFAAMARTASAGEVGLALREELGALGRGAEACMLAATGGSNAHRGAIWVLGLLVAARSMDRGASGLAAVTARAAALARLPDRHAGGARSHGAEACARYGVRGARGEAADGFPHVLGIALPKLRERRLAGAAEDHARLDALLAVMASLDDTCLLHRGGRAALEAAQSGARTVLGLGGTATAAGLQALLFLDAELVRRYASPGGSADLLAATLFLDGLPRAGLE